MTNPKFCGRCGWKTLPDSRFCGQCGFDFKRFNPDNPPDLNWIYNYELDELFDCCSPIFKVFNDCTLGFRKEDCGDKNFWLNVAEEWNLSIIDILLPAVYLYGETTYDPSEPLNNTLTSLLEIKDIVNMQGTEFIHQKKFPNLFPLEVEDSSYKNYKGIIALQRPPPSPFVRSETYRDPYAIFDPIKTDYLGDTVLMIASFVGYTLLVEKVLAKMNSKTINLKNSRGETALILAIKGWAGIVKKLGSRDGEKLVIVDKLLDQKEIDLTIRDRNGMSALDWAVRGSDDIVKRLLSTNQFDYHAVENALRVAVNQPNEDIFFKKGDYWPEIKERKAKMKKCSESIVTQLLEYLASVGDENQFKNTVQEAIQEVDGRIDKYLWPLDANKDANAGAYRLFTYAAAKGIKALKQEEKTEKCPICLEEATKNNPLKGKCNNPYCRHVFHADELDERVIKNNICPVCRRVCKYQEESESESDSEDSESESDSEVSEYESGSESESEYESGSESESESESHAIRPFRSESVESEARLRHLAGPS